jgi:anti-sigma-K factor RskA
MAEHDPHADLAGYLLGRLDPEERERFQRHVVTCPTCRAQLDELSALPRLLERAAEPFEVPGGLEARTLSAIEREAAPDSGARRARRLRLAAVASVAAAVAVALVLGIQIGRSQTAGVSSPGGQGNLEMREVLRSAADPTRTASAEVRDAGLERLIYLRTRDLRPLPRGGYYELWLVGPGDRRGHPNRVSAGTFRTDRQGDARVVLAVGIDPADFTIITISNEPRDGDPAWVGRDEMRSDVYAQ